MKKIIIGDKPLSEITKEDVLKLIMLIGCCPSLEFFDEPIITSFNNTRFSTTIVLGFHSIRKHDKMVSSSYKFFFNHNDFSYHYYNTVVSNSRNGRLKLPELKFIIDQGYDVPLY